MARRLGELAIAIAIASAFGCGDDANDPSADTGDGTSGGTATDGTGPGDDDGDSADDADSTGAPAGCGNGVIDEGEVCDDGEANGTYGQCTAACDGVTSCGDGEVQKEGGEVCDDGEANGAYGSCAADCSDLGPRCGDGILQRDQEGCDDGNEVVGDGCNAGCVLGGQVVSSWLYDHGENEPEHPRAIGVLADGRFFVAGWYSSDSRPFLMAFDEDEASPFYTFIAPENGGGYRSAVTMPDGRVLATGDANDGLEQLGMRSWFDLDASTQTPDHIVDAGYSVRAAALRGGGHVLCNNLLGLVYYGSASTTVPEWDVPNVQCHAVTADATGVAQARTEVGGGGGYTVAINVYLHGGLPKWNAEFSQGGGAHAVNGIAIDSAHNVVVAGYFEAEQSAELTNRPMLRKYDDQGELVWSANAFFTTRSEWNGVAVDALDNVVVVGYHMVTVTLDGSEIDIQRPTLRKYSADGEPLWSWQDDAWNEDDPYLAELEGVAVVPNGDVIAAGHRESPGGADDLLLVRLTP